MCIVDRKAENNEDVNASSIAFEQSRKHTQKSVSKEYAGIASVEEDRQQKGSKTS
jgi:hypothetical protein